MGKKTRTVRLVARSHSRMLMVNDFIRNLFPLFPTRNQDEKLIEEIAAAFQYGSASDWNNVGDDMWIAFSKYADASCNKPVVYEQ